MPCEQFFDGYQVKIAAQYLGDGRLVGPHTFRHFPLDQGMQLHQPLEIDDELRLEGQFLGIGQSHIREDIAGTFRNLYGVKSMQRQNMAIWKSEKWGYFWGLMGTICGNREVFP